MTSLRSLDVLRAARCLKRGPFIPISDFVIELYSSAIVIDTSCLLNGMLIVLEFISGLEPWIDSGATKT